MYRLLFLFTFICSFSSLAQRGNMFGQKIGYSYSSLTGDATTYIDGAESSEEPNFERFYGLFANISISENFSIQSEIDLILSGTKSTPLPYLSFPLFLKYYPKENFNLQFGGALNYLLVEMLVDYYSDPQGWRAYHRYDAGLYGGVGFDLPKVQYFIRYYHGITNISPLRNYWAGVNGESYFFDFTEMNRSLQFGIEYKLIKKKKKDKQRGYKYARPN